MDFARAPGQPASRELTIVNANPHRYASDFAPWLLNNWHIWREFCRQADAMRERGRAHYSARTIIHWIRHNTALAEVEGDWKVNNNFSPDMGRLYADLRGCPEFFEFRIVPGSSKRAA